MGMNDINSLAHTKWNCKYHIVFAPKYRRKVFYQEKREAVGKLLRRLCEWKGVRIVEAEVCPDHIHMLVEIPPKIAVSSFMGYLKGKSSTMLYEQFGELKYKYRNREFWCKGYYVDTVGKNESRIAEYIENQLKEDEMGEQLTMSQYGAVDKVSLCSALPTKKDAHRRHPACFIIRFRFNAVADKRQWSSAASKPRRKMRAKLCSRFCAENEPSHQTCRSFSASRYSGL